MASRGQSIVVSFVAWDTSANAGKTGDVANFTLRVVKDGTASAPTNSASEVDSTNCPGVYKITLTTTECTADCVTVCGKSSTANVSIIPVTITFEQLPTATPGASNGLPQIGVAPLTYLDASIAAVLDDTGTSGVVVAAASKSGYSISGTKTTLDALQDLTAAQVNAQVLDVMSIDTFSQPGQENPAATQTISKMVAYLYKAWRNRTTQTSSEYALYADDGSTKDQEAAVSDDGTTFVRGEVQTGA